MSTTTLRREIDIVSPTRQRVMGGLFLVLGLVIWFLFSRSTDPAVVTTFKMTPGGFDSTLPDLVLPSLFTLNILTAICVGLGLVQLIRPGGFAGYTNLVLGVVSGFFIFAFLTWAAA